MYFHHFESGSVDEDLIEASRIEIRKILVKYSHEIKESDIIQPTINRFFKKD